MPLASRTAQAKPRDQRTPSWAQSLSILAMPRSACPGVRGVSTFRLHPALLAGPAAGEVSAHPGCIHCCLQDLPLARYQRILIAASVACRTCRWRGVSACRLHPGLLAGAADGEAAVRAVCIHCWWQELPLARHQRMPLASRVAGRSCRWRGISAGRLHPLLLAGAAAGEASEHAACTHCCWQELPVARHQRMPLAPNVAGKSCRGEPWCCGAACGSGAPCC